MCNEKRVRLKGARECQKYMILINLRTEERREGGEKDVM
jgi:hypothetical protein